MSRVSPRSGATARASTLRCCCAGAWLMLACGSSTKFLGSDYPPLDAGRDAAPGDDDAASALDGGFSPEPRDAGSPLDPDLLPPGAPNRGIYLYWLFDSGSITQADDVSGNARHGLLTNVPSPSEPAPSARPGNLRGTFFNGPGASATRELDQALPRFTVGLWVRPAQTSVAAIFARVGASGAASVELLLGASGRFELRTSAGCDVPGSCIVGSTVVQAERWFHVAFSAADDGSLRLFVDGRDQGAGQAAWLGTASDQLRLGSDGDATIPGVRGNLDELMVYDWLLTPEEIALLAARQ